MNGENIPNYCGGASQVAFDEAHLAASVDGYLHAAWLASIIPALKGGVA